MQLAAPSIDLLTAGQQRPCEGGGLTQSSAVDTMGDGSTPFEQELGLAEVGDEVDSMPAETDAATEAPAPDGAPDESESVVEDGANVVPLVVCDQAVVPSGLDQLAGDATSAEPAETNTSSSVVVFSEPQIDPGADTPLNPSVGSSVPEAVEQANVGKPVPVPVPAPASPEAEALTGDAPASVQTETVEQSDGVAKPVTMAALVADKPAPQPDEGGQAQLATGVSEVQSPASTGLEGTNVSDHESDGQPTTSDGAAPPQSTVASEMSGDFDEALPVGSDVAPESTETGEVAEDGDQVLPVVQDTTPAATEGKLDELHVDVPGMDEAHTDAPAPSTSTETTIQTPVERAAGTDTPVQELVAPARDDQAAVEAFRTAMVERIARAAQDYLRDGQSQMRIRLSPPELGEMRVHFSMDGDHASAEVTVSKPEAVQLIMQHIEQLRRNLAQVGVELGSFDVSEQETPHGRQQQNGRSESGGDWQDFLNNLDLGMDSEEAELNRPAEVSPGLVANWRASLTAGHSSFEAIA